jgi:hypothetical protein
MGAWPEREAPAERTASVVLAVEKGMDSSIPFSVALCFFFRELRDLNENHSARVMLRDLNGGSE